MYALQKYGRIKRVEQEIAQDASVNSIRKPLPTPGLKGRPSGYQNSEIEAVRRDFLLAAGVFNRGAQPARGINTPDSSPAF